MSRLLFLLLALPLLLPSLLLADDNEVRIGDRPDWVTVENWDSSTTAPTLGTGNESVVYLLRDYQHYPQQDEKYSKRVYRVTNDTGVQQKLKVTFDFDPSYSKLILHDISIRRGEKTIDKCDISKMKIFQPEDDLSRDIYDEHKRVLIFLDDLRVDDIVVVESTVVGTNPAIKEHYSFRLPLQFNVPVEKASYRLLWDAETPIFFQARNSDLQPVVTKHDKRTEYAWAIPPQPTSRYEDQAPIDFNDRPYLEVSNSKDWKAVVDWGLETYKTLDDPLTPETLQIIDQWKQESSKPEELASKALRFVQDKIRYVGLEMGPESLRPAAPNKTMECRFGDCKAKSILLSAILRRMDIKASPALVNTYRGSDIENSLPTPFAFDHVIVRASLSGKTVWVDPTFSQQGGAFSESYIPSDYGKGLVIADGVDKLEVIHSPSKAMDYEHTEIIFDVDDFDGTATMKVNTRFHGSAADSMRRSLIDTNYEALVDEYLNYYSDKYPGIRDPAPLVITDDRERNVIIVKEQYLVDKLFNPGEEGAPSYVEIYPYGLRYSLPLPETRIRKTPLAIDHPVRRTYKTVLNTPAPLGYDDSFDEVVDPAFKFSTRLRCRGNCAEFEDSIETLRDRVAPDEVTQYLANYEKLQDLLGYYPEAPTPVDSSVNWFAILTSFFTIAIVSPVAFWATTATTSEDAKIAEPEYESIGGWLVLVAVQVTLGALTTPLWFARDWDSYFTWSLWTGLDIGFVLTFELIVNSAMTVLTIALAVSFFTKRKIFPKLYIFTCVCWIMYFTADRALCYSLLDWPFDPEDYREIFGLVLRTAIWCPYMLLSQRVKGTFVR